MNSQDSLYERVPLLWAAINGHEAVVKLLLAKDGDDVNSRVPGPRLRTDAAVVRGREGARGGGQAAVGEGRTDAAIMGGKQRALGGGQAAAGQG